MKKISYLDISIFMFYILQAFLFIYFISYSIKILNFNYILFLIISIFLGISVVLLFCFLFNLSNKNIFYNIKNKCGNFFILVL